MYILYSHLNVDNYGRSLSVRVVRTSLDALSVECKNHGVPQVHLFVLTYIDDVLSPFKKPPSQRSSNPKSCACIQKDTYVLL